MLQQQSSVSNPSMYVLCRNMIKGSSAVNLAHIHNSVYSVLHCRLSEVDHFQRVLKHTAFQEDPLSAITEHINNSLAKHIL